MKFTSRSALLGERGYSYRIRRPQARTPTLLVFVFLGLLEGVLEVHDGFAGFERVLKHLFFGFELFGRVVRRFDAQADAAFVRVDLDDAAVT